MPPASAGWSSRWPSRAWPSGPTGSWSRSTRAPTRRSRTASSRSPSTASASSWPPWARSTRTPVRCTATRSSPGPPSVSSRGAGIERRGLRAGGPLGGAGGAAARPPARARRQVDHAPGAAAGRPGGRPLAHRGRLRRARPEQHRGLPPRARRDDREADRRRRLRGLDGRLAGGRGLAGGGRGAGGGVGGGGAPAGSLDCGNSGTTLRLLAGILAGTPLATILDGDDSLRRRPVARIIEPLRAMGATLHARSDDTLPPLSVTGRRPLRSIDHATPVPSAQVKSAVLLAGLAAEGTTTGREAVATRDHTERMLRARGVAVTSEVAGPGGPAVVSVEGGQTVRPIDERIPGDISAAAFWLVAGAAHPDAQLVLERVGVNPTRRRVLDLLRAMGADIVERPVPGVAGGEPVGDLEVRSSELRAIEMGPADAAPALAH